MNKKVRIKLKSKKRRVLENEFYSWKKQEIPSKRNGFSCLEFGVGTSGGESRLVQTLRNAAGQRELDLAIVKLFHMGSSALVGLQHIDLDDLNAVGPGSVAGTHVTIALGDGGRDGQVTVLAVHVVSAAAGVVAQPDAEVLDLLR